MFFVPKDVRFCRERPLMLDPVGGAIEAFLAKASTENRS
jgi:hypothetical protein